MYVPMGVPMGKLQMSGLAALQLYEPGAVTEPNVKPAPKVSVKVVSAVVAAPLTVVVRV